MKKILFITRYPKKKDLMDGYFQRVLAVDNIFSEFNRCYIDYGKFTVLPSVKKIKNSVFEIKTSKYNFFGLLLIVFFAIKSDAVYFHSILRLKSFFHKIILFISEKSIIDLHGVVPEEFRMHGDTVGYEIFNKIEKVALSEANIVIGVTNKMIEYVIREHNIVIGKKVIILPILPGIKDIPSNVSYGKINSMIYCGGLQKWQQIDKMLEFVNMHDNYDFAFLVPDPEKIIEMYIEKYKKSFNGVVISVESDLVTDWYEKYSFGLVFREDMIVNNVACPTKLIEYFQNDVVPIVDSVNIGDFKDLGYAFVRYDDKLPTQDEWKKMVLQNREVLKRMYDIFEIGAEKLKSNI